MRKTAAQLIDSWIDGIDKGDLKDYCGLSVRTEFIEAAIVSLSDTYPEAIQVPAAPVHWQQKPDKEPKRKTLDQKGKSTVPPGTSKYHEPDWSPYQGVS